MTGAASSRAGVTLRRLGADDMTAAAATMRASFDARLPWLAGRHSPEADRRFFREQLLPRHELWGAFRGARLAGIVAFSDGWIDQLYVRPEDQNAGIGAALLGIAKASAPGLSLRTFQRNTCARAFYERHGFVVVEAGDGSGNEEREPDLLYRWPAAEAA